MSLDLDEAFATASMSQFKDAPRYQAWMSAFRAAIELVATDLDYLLTSTDIDNAEDFFLDQWGVILNERRGGLVDDEYRVILQIKIASLLSTGTLDQIYSIWVLLTSAGLARNHWESFSPPTLWLAVQFADGATLSASAKTRVRRLLDLASPSAVLLNPYQYPETYINFSEDSGESGWGNPMIELIE